MTEREALEALLVVVDTRKGDNYWDPCCSNCYHERWHNDRFDNGGVGVKSVDDMWKAAVPKCDCPCHEARRVLGREDAIHDPRWEAPSA